jgi:putative aldouronate transport system permease protein
MVFYPFYNAVLSSFVTSRQYSLKPAMIFPPEIIFDNYDKILNDSNLLSGYRNTILLVLFGVPYSMFLTVSMAYAFSRKRLRGKRGLFLIALFTMFFSGGVVPIYLNVKNLGLLGTIVPIILMYGINTYYMIIVKSCFEQLPDSIEDAAKIDGANDLTIFFRIMLPLMTPIIATFSLFIMVDRWNEWYFSMLFIKDGLKQPLQLVLRGIIAESTAQNTLTVSMSPNIYADGIKMASVVVTMLPVMLVYPFVQKYFVRGIMMGAIKM